MSQNDDIASALERLKVQRRKAFQALEKVSDMEKSCSSLSNSTSNRCKFSKTHDIGMANKFNDTDYVMYGRKEVMNITDLMTEHTDDLNTINTTTMNKVSFEPTEITGRSTMCTSTMEPKSQRYSQSVKDILSQSVADDIRCLSETLPNSDISNTLKFRMCCIKDQRKDNSNFSNDSFRPGEMMNSRLASDERSWEQQYVDIPNCSGNKKLSSKYESTSFSVNPSTNFSIGDFFNKRSDDMGEILVNSHSPIKRPALPLVDQSRYSYKPSSSQGFNKTPKLDGKICRKSLASLDMLCKTIDREKIDVSNKSKTLSLSTIANALDELRIDDSIENVLNRFRDSRQVTRSNSREMNYNRALDLNSETRNSLEKDMAEKENCDPSLSTHRYFELQTAEHSSGSWRNFLGFKGQATELLKNQMHEAINPAKFQSKNRKRSYSATRFGNNTSPDIEAPIRRSRSPQTCVELAVASGVKNIAEISKTKKTMISNEADTLDTSNGLERKNIINTSSPDGGLSVISCGLILQSPSSVMNFESKECCFSQCTSSSEYSHRNNVLPLKATSLEVVWGCIKLRKTAQKSIQIKNNGEKKLRLKAEVLGPGFQLAAASEVHSLVLQSFECRTLNLSFCPTMIGPAAGQLIFMSAHGTNRNNKNVKINLYGYGGHSQLTFRGITKGPIGTPFLSMGELRDLPAALENSFVISNKGQLTGFACIFVDSVGVEIPYLCDSIEVIPRTMLVKPESNVCVKVVFRPKREFIKKIYKKIFEKSNNVMTLAVIKIIFGEDVTRRRVRKLIYQMNAAERANFEGTKLADAWKMFIGEEQDDQMLKEKTDSAIDLLSTLQSYELAITVNHTLLENTLDETLLFSENDETVMFKTIISSDNTLCNNRGDLLWTGHQEYEQLAPSLSNQQENELSTAIKKNIEKHF